MKQSLIPAKSALHNWVNALSITELPVSYQVLVGLAALGASLKRSVYVEQQRFKVYPNMSVLLVGPSGIGKDTAINEATELVERIGSVPIVAGRTMEFVTDQLYRFAGDPAACYTPAPELAAFLGGKDYQKGMVTELTDLLSTNNAYRGSGTKGDGARVIPRPTVTMLAGSTPAWLQNALPKESLEGGFLPRFVVICEDKPAKSVAWVAYDISPRERLLATTAFEDYVRCVAVIVNEYAGRRSWELWPTDAARDYYRNWYENRYTYFSAVVQPYAHRSRDLFLKVAMLMALTCGRNYLDEEDCVFATAVFDAVAAGMDRTVAPMIGGRRRGRPRLKEANNEQQTTDS